MNNHNGDVALPLHRHRKKRKLSLSADEQHHKQQEEEADDADAVATSTDGGGGDSAAARAAMGASSPAIPVAAAAAADGSHAKHTKIHQQGHRKRCRRAADGDDYPLLVTHVSTFLNYYSSLSSSSTTAAAASSSSSPTSTISYMADFLKNSHDNNKNHDNVTLSKKDVASILLPWSVSRLLAREQKNEMELSHNDCSSFVEEKDRLDDDRDEDSDEDDDEDIEISDVGLVDNNNDDCEGFDNDDYMQLLEWIVLSHCLDVLDATTIAVSPQSFAEGSTVIETADDEGTSLISSTLTQSTLNRLLSRAVRVALTPATFATSMTESVKRSEGLISRRKKRRKRMADAASNVYVHLVQHGKYYRPTTLDVACQTLLRLVDEYSMLISRQQLQQRRCPRQWMERTARVRNATLSMVHMLVETATNHKRVFVILSSTEVLPILGRWMMTTSSSISTDDEQQRAAIIVGDILQTGLYNINVSIDGYRSVISRLDEEVRAREKEVAAVSSTVKEKSTPLKRDKWMCFQSSLFNSIRRLVFPPPLETPPSSSTLPSPAQPPLLELGERDDVVIAMAGILPLITRGFFDRVLLSRNALPLQQQQQQQQQEQQQKSFSEGGSSSSTTIEGDANLQFCFWRHIISPVVDQLSFLFGVDNSTSLSSMQICRQQKQCLRALLGAMSETLELVLKYDAYSPSYTDVDGENLSFLERVTKCLMCCCSRRPMRRDDDRSIDSLILKSLHCILSLNHRLLHERLADVISFACSCLQSSSSSASSPLSPAVSSPDAPQSANNIHATPSSSRSEQLKSTSKLANDILSDIVKTYRELRQVGYFLSSARGAFASALTAASRRGGDTEGCKMMLMIRLGNITEDLALAYQTCPSGQICEIWSFFNAWTSDNVSVCRQNDLESENATKEERSGSGGEARTSESSNDNDDNSNNLITPAASTFMKEHVFAVHMFIMFIQNIRAGKQNCTELRGLCEATMSTSVSKLLIGTKSATGRRDNCNGLSPEILSDFKRGEIAGADQVVLMRLRHGFDLCGWLVDLHTRCCFWMDGGDAHSDSRGTAFLLSHNENDCSNDVLSYLQAVAKTSLSTQRFKLWRSTWIARYWQSRAIGSSSSSSGSDCSSTYDCFEDLYENDIPRSLHGSLQRLALHRIHQLHSMIYYCNLREHELHTSEDNLHVDNASSMALTNEARMLVDFSMYLACFRLTTRCNYSVADESSSESLWIPMAQSLCIWSRYSDAVHIELFLIWFFGTLCWRYSLEATADQVFKLETNVALTLARDASFYDIGDVMSLFMRVGIQFATSRFLDSIVSIDVSYKMKILEFNSGSTKLCMDLAKTEGAKLARDNHVDAVSTTLTFLASAPIELTLTNQNVKLVDGIVGLDILSSQMIKHGVDVSELDSQQILNIVHSNKIILSNLLPKALLLSSDFEDPCLANMACHLLKSCLDFRSADNVVAASCNAITEYFTLCVDYYERNNNALVELFTQLESLVRDIDVDFSPKATFIRSVIRRMNILDRYRSLSKISTATIPSTYELCLQFVLETQEVLQSIDFQYLSKAGRGLENDIVAAKALLLESEVWSFIGSHIEATPGSILITNGQVNNAVMSVGNLFRSILRAQESPCSLVFINTVDYFLSAMAVAPGFFLQCVPTSELIDMVLEELAQSFARGQESTCLDAALCSLIRAPGVEQTKTAINHLLSKSNGCSRLDSAFITKAFHLLITSSNSQEQNKCLSDTCPKFLLISIGLLRDRQCTMTELASNVMLLSKTLTTIISKKELLLLSGREIAMICCEMIPILDDNGVNKHDADGVSASIFISCCTVVASLIAHYPKQLYGCPSPLFSLMLALLSNVLRTSVKKGLSNKAQEYAKVCELLIPHKDILKKHVVGLILHYIWSLNDGLNPTIKSKLTPSIFALLDMLSEFETRQINAMIDAPSKALFAPVFRSYQKYYQYHGQA